MSKTYRKSKQVVTFTNQDNTMSLNSHRQ